MAASKYHVEASVCITEEAGDGAFPPITLEIGRDYWRIIDPNAPRGADDGPPESHYLSLDVAEILVEFFSAYNIFLSRNKIYGGAYRATGVLGSVVNLTGDLERLLQIVVRDGKISEHRLEVGDKLRDIVNFALIGLLMLREHNYNGRGGSRG